jgi:valyl-tRNA synthetase
MDTNYNHKLYEDKIYDEWEKSGAFKPNSYKQSLPLRGKKTFSIIMPPPNANDPLHIGHAMFITIEDILIRFHRMLGDSTLWLPGTDHAGIETQFVFEKKLAKKGHSRFDFDRDTLYKMIWDYVQENSQVAVNQMKKLGASADWCKFKFTLDPDIVKLVKETFVKLNEDGLIYRGERLVNYCTKCGTGYSELEVEHVDQEAKLYYIKYGPFVLATTRPETKFADTAIAVHPKDKRYKKYVGQEIECDGLLGKFKIKVIADNYVDPEFGTGVVKITPFHDFNDYEIWQRHKDEMPEPKQIIDKTGKLTQISGIYAGMKVKAAREQIEKDLEERGLLDRPTENYKNTVGTCYRCHSVLEPLPLEQFFIKVKPLADKALKALDKKETVVLGAGQEKILRHWLNNLKDWNISRNIVWGIRIPAWFAPNGEFVISIEKPDGDWKQDTDTFDTWFSSGQWPFATLGYPKSKDFDKFYPTTVMETGYDILPFWVMRMMLLGIYMTGKSPFKTVYLHGLVRDEQGRKMSKSIGNVINPLDMVEKYGTDALRFALVMSSTPAQDKSVGENSFRGMRNFSNKIWN